MQFMFVMPVSSECFALYEVRTAVRTILGLGLAPLVQAMAQLFIRGP